VPGDSKDYWKLMPTWTWIVIGVAAAAAVAALMGIAFTVWNRAVRRYVRLLVAKLQEGRGVRRALEELVGALRDASAEERAAFADDPQAVERHSLADLSSRAHELAEELNTMPLPQRLVESAEALADAADVLGEEADRAGEGSIGDESLMALASADLERVSRAFAYAEAKLAPLVSEFGVDEQDVYGGGLYI
jgi:hypothetical protein